MSKPLSTDLRDRIMRLVASGKSCRAAAAHFDVAPSTVIKLQQRYARTGSVEPARRGRPYRAGKLGPHREWLIARVEAKPDITMPDLAAQLEAEKGVKVDPPNISKLLCREGYTYKKRCWPASKSALTFGRTGPNGGAIVSLRCAVSPRAWCLSTKRQ